MMTRSQAAEMVVSNVPEFELEQIDVNGVPWRVYKNAPRSLREVFESSAQFADREVVSYEDEVWTFEEMHRIVKGLARRWHDLGIEKGDRIAVSMRNYPEWIFAFWATQSIGAIIVPLNAWWTTDELRYALGDSTPKMLIVDSERLERVEGLIDELGIEHTIAVRAGEDLPDGVRSWASELAATDPEATLPDVQIDPEDDATILYTSGTTGFPKGAIGTNRNHITNIMNTALSAALNNLTAGITPPEDPPQSRTLQTFPYFHIAGVTGLYAGTAFGGRTTLMYKWDTAKAAELIQNEGLMAVAGVPTTLRQLLEYAEKNGLTFDTLTGIAGGGAPIPPDLITGIETHFSQRVAPGNGYGLTETTSAVVMNAGVQYFAYPDSVGSPMPGADVRIVLPGTEDDAEQGEIGELWFRGPNVVRGYWNKPEKTAEAFTDGWFHTGDLGYISEQGLVYVVDRIKDVVIRGGENVYCAEVEAVLFDHPGVADVAVIGLPHPSLGEEVVAVVDRAPGSDVDAAELQRHVAGRLAEFKVPTQVRFVDEGLPRTATGKVLKRDLRDQYAGTPPTS